MRKILGLIIILILVVPGGASAQEELMRDPALGAGRVDTEQTVAQLTASIEERSRQLAEGYRQRGLAYERQGRPDLARADYNRGLDIDPDVVELYYQRGLLAFRNGNNDSAIADLTRYLEARPDSSVSLLVCGCIYYKRSDYAAAIADFNKVLEINDENAYLASVNLANSYLRVGNLDKVREIVEKLKDRPAADEAGEMDFLLIRPYDEIIQELQAASQ